MIGNESNHSIQEVTMQLSSSRSHDALREASEDSQQRSVAWREFVWIAIFAGFSACSACSDSGNKTKSYPGTARVVLPGERRGVVVENPREKGEKDIVFSDGSREGNTDAAAAIARGGRIVQRYGVALVQLVRHKDGRVVCPVMLVRHPRYGQFRAVYYEDDWSVELQAIAPNEAPDDGWAHFAVSDEIQEYVLLLKSFNEETGWRVLELKPEKISKAKTVQIPDLLTLTSLEKHPDGEKLWKIHLAAEKEEDRLKSLE